MPTNDEPIYFANPDLMDTYALRRFMRTTELATQHTVNPDASWEAFKYHLTESDDELNALLER